MTDQAWVPSQLTLLVDGLLGSSTDLSGFGVRTKPLSRWAPRVWPPGPDFVNRCWMNSRAATVSQAACLADAPRAILAPLCNWVPLSGLIYFSKSYLLFINRQKPIEPSPPASAANVSGSLLTALSNARRTPRSTPRFREDAPPIEY